MYGAHTDALLRQQIPELVWDSAIAAGWWRADSETPLDIFPEKLGRYWVWRDERADGLFETEGWLVRMAAARPVGARDLGARLNAGADAP